MAGSPVAEVTGRVTVDGKPAAGLSLQFTPEGGREDDGGKLRPSAFATTDSDGRYRAVRMGRNLYGASVGRNRVRVFSSDESVVTVDALYGGDSPLTCEVGPRPTVFDIELVAKPVGPTKAGK